MGGTTVSLPQESFSAHADARWPARRYLGLVPLGSLRPTASRQ